MSNTAKLATAALFCGMATVNASELTIETVSHLTSRPALSAQQISGITYAGGNLFYAVDDNDNNMYSIKMDIDLSDGSLASSNVAIKAGCGVLMSDANDMEGCAYDPASGKVWVSQESGALIREYDPATGNVLRSAPVPGIMKQYYGNFSLEALTISGDGKTMWTCNEEGLKCDADMLPGVGSVATKTSGSTVRLTRFTRESVTDNWKADGQWAYLTEPVGTDPDWISVSTNSDGTKTTNYVTRSGVSGLCALPDGTLLALERRCYKGGSFPDFQMRIFQVDFSGATEVSSISSLKTATYTRVKKTQLWEYHDGSALPNYEGICLGPRLDDGSCVLVLVGDAGSEAEDGIFTLRLSGLNIRTMNFESPASGIGTPSIVGSNYRFVDGTELDVAILGEGFEPREYTNRADVVASAAYSLPAHGRNDIAGTVASFAVTADDTLSWTTSSSGAAGGDIFLNDTFEGYAVGAVGGKVVGWSGDGVVVECGYTPPATGYVMQNAAHTKVLDADGGARRSVAADASAGTASRKLDVMIEVHRPQEPLGDFGEQVQIAVAANANGELCVWHSRDEGGVVRDGWTPLSSEKFAEGEWVRVGIEVEYSGGTGFARLRLNGSICTTPYGYRNPDGQVAGGAWHRLASSASSLGEISFMGTKVDDLIVTTKGYPSEDASAALSTGGVPNAWFDENGLPRDATAKTGIPGYTMADVFATGVDPYGTEPFKITSFSVDSVPTIEFNGLESSYRSFKVLRSSTPDFRSGTVTELGAGDGTFTGNASDWSTRWEGKAATSASAFYKVVVE